MWSSEKRNKVKEGLSRIICASVSGYALGTSISIAERLVLPRSEGRPWRGTDFMLLGGSYAAAEIAMETYGLDETYVPIVAGCIAGTMISKNSMSSLITTSAMTAATGYLYENRERLFGKMEAVRERKP